jgi:hypothetical protein
LSFRLRRTLRFEASPERIGPSSDVSSILFAAFIRGPDGDLYLGISSASPYPDKVLRYDGTTGALLGNFLPRNIGFGHIKDLLVARMDVRLRPVPVLWRRVPRWLQVIVPITFGIVIGIVAASLARISVRSQNLRSRLNRRFR